MNEYFGKPVAMDHRKMKRDLRSTRKHCKNLAHSCNKVFMKSLKMAYQNGYNYEKYSNAHKQQLNCLKIVNRKPCKVNNFNKIKKRILKLTSPSKPFFFFKYL